MSLMWMQSIPYSVADRYIGYILLPWVPGTVFKVCRKLTHWKCEFRESDMLSLKFAEHWCNSLGVGHSLKCTNEEVGRGRVVFLGEQQTKKKYVESSACHANVYHHPWHLILSQTHSNVSQMKYVYPHPRSGLFWCPVSCVGLRRGDTAQRAAVCLSHSCLNISQQHPSLWRIVSYLVFKRVLCLRALLLTQVQGCTKKTSPSTSPPVSLSAVHLCVSHSSATNFVLNTTGSLTIVRFILSCFASVFPLLLLHA